MDLPESICPLPWQNLSLDVDGSSRPCCKFAHHDPDSDYQMANLRDASLEEVWNGEGMRRLRRDFLDGKRPAECTTCWDEEAAGIASLRQTWFWRGLRHEPDYDGVEVAHPSALDLKLTNACNLKCRICGPVASSLWLGEEARLHGDDLDPYLAENRRWFLANKITEHPENAVTFRTWLPHLEHVELTGGEPMMSPENRAVVELLVEEGDPAGVALLVTTNATVVDERIVGPFDRFGRVTVSLSIDDIGGRIEYERAPARWDEIEANIRRYAGMAGETVQIYLNCSVSTLNVWYLPEFVAWLTADPRLAPIGLHLNLVHNARHHNIQSLPDQLKDAVRARLEPMVTEPAVPPDIQIQVAEVVEFLGANPGDPEQWSEFLRLTRDRDAVRDEDFASTFPEYHEAMVATGCWWTPPASVSSEVPVHLGVRRSVRRVAGRARRAVLARRR